EMRPCEGPPTWQRRPDARLVLARGLPARDLRRPETHGARGPGPAVGRGRCSDARGPGADGVATPAVGSSGGWRGLAGCSYPGRVRALRLRWVGSVVGGRAWACRLRRALGRL